MSLNANIIDQRVVELARQLDQRFREELGAGNDDARKHSLAFVLLCVKEVLDLDLDEAFDCLVDGGRDAGIDAIRVEAVSDGEFTVHLFQGKYRRRLDGEAGFPMNAMEKLVTTVQTLFDPFLKPARVNERLRAVVEEVRSLVADGNMPDVRMYFCNNGASWSADAQAMLEERLNSDQVTYEHVNHDHIVRAMRRTEPVDATFHLAGRHIVETYKYRRALIGRMPVAEVARLFAEHGDRLLERNVRRYLGLERSRVNSEIYRTLADSKFRPDFYFLNNGLTMVCTQFRENALQAHSTAVKTSGLKVINGGQTSKTIQTALSKMAEEDFSDAHVLVRLYELEADDVDFMRRVTFATNSQNPVDLRDLRSNDEVQQNLEVGLSALGFQYKRQRDGTVSGASTITISVAAEALHSVVNRRPHEAKFRRAQLFGKFYDRIFHARLNASQVLLAVLVFRHVENERRRFSLGEPPRFLTYASHFLAMLMADELLAAEGLEHFRDVGHTNVDALRQRLDQDADRLYRRALERLTEALRGLFDLQTVTLQRLSASFRRGDLLQQIVQP